METTITTTGHATSSAALAVADATAGLVERAAAGDRDAFAALYRAHMRDVYRYVLFRVRHEDAAADLTQEVLVRAWLRLGTLRDATRFRPWLLRIAHNRVLNHVQRRVEERVGLDGLLLRPDGGASPGEQVEAQLELERVLAAAHRITELQQQVIALRFISGLSVAETATVMDRSSNAIRNLQHKALAAIRRVLADEDRGSA
jgi:RNA polymerase sigma-70 factor (ECF subfamily)